MYESFYRQTANIEDRHWWFVHRRALVEDLLSRTEDPPAGGTGLDVGCGAGGNLSLLARWATPAVGLDRSDLALRLARKKRPEAALVRADANRLAASFAPASFDLVTVFNVLYHRWVEDELKVLEQIRELLRPRGLLVLSEPAFPSLFRRHDVLDHGARRYRLPVLRGYVEQAGFSVLRATYFNHVAFLPALVLAGLDRLRGRLATPVSADEERVEEMRLPAPWLNRLMLAVGHAERAWIARVGGLPFGVGALILARREQGLRS